MTPDRTGHRVPLDEDRPVTLVGRLRPIWLKAARNGLPLPGEATLARELGVSRPALREALARLETQGLILRRRGSDTVVNTGALDVLARFDVQIDYAEMLTQAGFTPSLELLESSRQSVDEDQAERLGCEVGAPALRTVKRWRANERVAMVAIDTVPLPSVAVDVDVHESLFALVQELTGEAVEWEIAYVSAVNVEPPVTSWLECEPGAAALTVELFGVSGSGRRAFHAMEYHVPGIVDYGFIRSVRAPRG